MIFLPPYWNDMSQLGLLLCSVVGRRLDQVYVVTSDAEAAIRGGLETSALRDASTQILCGLHAKWNVSAHKYVNVGPHTSRITHMYHSDVSLTCITLTYHSHVSLTRITLTYHSHVSLTCITLTYHSHVSLTRITLTYHSHVSL